MGRKVTAADIQVEIAKGAFRPHTALSNMALSYFQSDKNYFARTIFPMCPVSLSADNYYIFSKEDLLRDSWKRKPAYGKVEPAVLGENGQTSGKKTKSILTAIFKSWGITISKYTGPNVAHKKILLKNKKLGDIIREVLDEAKKKGGGAAIVRSTESKVQVIAKGSNTDIYHFSGDVSSQVSHKISIANLVTRVKIVSSGKSDEAAKVEATVNGKTQYGVFQTIITHSKSDKLDDAKKEAKEILEEKGSPKVTSKLIAPDIPCVRKGDIIHAKVGSLNGYYLINSIQHNAKNGQMTMDVKKTADPTAAPKKKTPGTTKKKTYKVGDVVNFKGGTHYDSSWSDARGYRATAGKAKITLGPNCAGNGKAHPWHLVHMDSKSNVYGWVDEGTFE